MFDFLTIQWDNVNLSLHDLDLWFPSSLPVPLTFKFFLRKCSGNPVPYSKLLPIILKMVKLDY